MKTLSADLLAHIQGEETTLAMAVKLTLTKYQPRIVNITQADPGVVETLWDPDFSTGDNARFYGVRGMTELNDTEVALTKIDGTHYSIGVDTTGFSPYESKGELRKIIGFTEARKSFIYQNVTYNAAVGQMPKSIKAGSDLSVDNLEVVGIMQNKTKAIAESILLQGLNDEDLRVGRLDHARVEIFYVNYLDLTQGRLILPGAGNIGQVVTKRGTYEAELRGKTIYLQETFGDLYALICRAYLGDDVEDYRLVGYGCKVRLDPPVWKASNPYTVRPQYDAALGSVVKPTTANNRHFVCTVAGISDLTEPAWSLEIGSATVEGSGVTWEAIQALTVYGSVTSVVDTRFFSDSSRSEPPLIGLGVTAAVAQYPIVALNQGSRWFAINGDETGIFKPGHTFSVTGSTGNDGTYTIDTVSLSGTRTRITVTAAIPNAKADGSIGGLVALPTGFFAFGKLTFLTGANKGISKEIKDFTLSAYAIAGLSGGFQISGDVTAFFAAGQQIAVSGSTANDGRYGVTSATYDVGSDLTTVAVSETIPDATADGSVLGPPSQFEMFERFPFDVEIGDQYEATAGCDKAKTTCQQKFDNVYNFRGEPEIPGTDAALLFPDAH